MYGGPFLRGPETETDTSCPENFRNIPVKFLTFPERENNAERENKRDSETSRYRRETDIQRNRDG